MANGNKLAEVCAMLVERDQDFRPLNEAAVATESASGEALWPMSRLVGALQVDSKSAVTNALNRAKVAAGKSEWTLADHFVDGSVFDSPGEVFLSKYAAFLFVMNCDPKHGRVGTAQAYFALQVDRQRLEDEKRVRTRLDVTSENKKLQGAAKDSGVKDFEKFNGVGIQGLYGGLNAAQVKQRKGLDRDANHLDFAGSEELAANLFRITQTRAALARNGVKSETVACYTHRTVAEGIRNTIRAAGNTLPEDLPAAELEIDRLASQVKKKLVSTKSI